MRYLTERDIKNWKQQRDFDDAKLPVLRSRLTQEQKQNREIMSMFQAWLDKQTLDSPYDDKNTADFKFITFTEFPPFTSQHRSALASVMTPSLWDEFRRLRTSHGFSFSNAIQSGVVAPEVRVGFAAGDEESYTLFADVIFRILVSLYQFDAYTQAHTSDLDPSHLVISPAHQEKLAQHVQRTRLQALRNLSGHPLPCGSSGTERRAVESVLVKALSGVTGRYYALSELPAAEAAALQAQDLTCHKPAPHSALANAGGAREWADGRGVSVNQDLSVVAFVNESDHCKLVVTEPSADIHKAFARMCSASASLGAAAAQQHTPLMLHPQLGFLTSCPSHAGSALSASLSVHLPTLNQDPTALRQMAAQSRLDAFRPNHHPTWDLSTRHRTGATEVELLHGMVRGVLKLINVEEAMAANPNMSAADALIFVNARA